MPTPREIKKHISTVGSISKVTRAMEMVSVAKNRRLQRRAESTRAFAERSWQVLTDLASADEDYVRQEPLFAGYGSDETLGMLLISGDKGMVGAFNQNIIAHATRYIRSADRNAQIITVGKLGREMMLREGYAIHADFSGMDDRADINDMMPLVQVLMDGFRQGVFDRVVVAYTPSRAGARLQPVVRPLLPIQPPHTVSPRQYYYDPNPHELLQALLPRLIRFQVYQAFLESLAAENVSRMLAMHAATKNADELMGRLTVSYNKARQQMITSEIMDILGGSAALDDNAVGE